jgi:hypothetical protein
MIDSITIILSIVEVNMFITKNEFVMHLLMIGNECLFAFLSERRTQRSCIVE